VTPVVVGERHPPDAVPGAGCGARAGGSAVIRTFGTDPSRGRGGMWLIACSARAVIVSDG
jgi:hypothetical protein